MVTGTSLRGLTTAPPPSSSSRTNSKRVLVTSRRTLETLFFNGQGMESESSRSTQSKHNWTEIEDQKLVEAMLDLHNTGRYTAVGGFKSDFIVEVGKALAIALPDSGLKVDPHIKSRVKTLKTNFGIVWDMLYGPNTSGFGYDDTTKCVVAERPVWDAYIQSHKKAHIFKDMPFPHFKDLCIIFGKDRATGEHAVAPGDLVEDLDREEEEASPFYHVEGGGLERMNFSQPEDEEPNIGSPGNNSEAGTSRKRKKKKGGQVDDAMIEVMVRGYTFMGESMKESAIIMSDAITDAKVNEMKQQLSSELAKIEGLSMTERVRATSKIAGDRNNTLIFYRFTPEERIEFVRTILE